MSPEKEGQERGGAGLCLSNGYNQGSGPASSG